MEVVEERQDAIIRMAGKLLPLLILALLIMGCTEKLTAEEILERVNEKYQSISSYKAIINLEDISDGKVYRTEATIAFKKPDRFKEDKEKTTSVINGSTWWIYNRTIGRATRINLPIPPSNPDFYYGLILEMVKEYSVSLEGEGRVMGKDCYLLEFSNLDRTPSKLRMWIVKGEWYPVRIEMRVEMEFPKELREKYGVSNVSSISILEFREIEFNAEIDDSEFSLPEDVTVEERPLIKTSPTLTPQQILGDDEVVNLLLEQPELMRFWSWKYRVYRLHGDNLTDGFYIAVSFWNESGEGDDGAATIYSRLNESGIHDFNIMETTQTLVKEPDEGERQKAMMIALKYLKKNYPAFEGITYSVPHVYRYYNWVTGEERFQVYVVPDNATVAYVVTIQDWNARDIEQTAYRGLGDFEVRLRVMDKGLAGRVTLCVALTYNGSAPRLIYYGHVNPLRIEVYQDGELIARLPPVLLDILKTAVMNPSEQIEFCDSLTLSKGVYKAVAYAELAFDDVVGCDQCWKRIYSNPVTVEVE
jgi:outer membrane lipoprotein-sorting protein